MYLTVLVYLAWYSFTIKTSVFMPGLNFCVNLRRVSLGGVSLIMHVYILQKWDGLVKIFKVRILLKL